MKKADLLRVFRTKCRGEERTTHHVQFAFRIDGKVYARTRISHGRGDVSKEITAAIAQQVGLSVPELEALVRCTFSAEDFYERLRRLR